MCMHITMKVRSVLYVNETIADDLDVAVQSTVYNINLSSISTTNAYICVAIFGNTVSRIT